MARIARNLLSIRALNENTFILSGYWQGKQIRKRSKDVDELEELKASMQGDTLKLARLNRPVQDTWLTSEQLRDAEAAITSADGRTLREYVEVGKRFLVSGTPVKCADALVQYSAWLVTHHRRLRTQDKNRLRIDDFLAHCQAEYLHEITPEMCEAWVMRDNLAAINTQVTDGGVLRAWLNYCVDKRWLRESPLRIDLNDLASAAKPADTPRILTPAQCKALLHAAATEFGGSLLPYTILTGWCLMRHAEVMRTRAIDLKLDAKTPVVKVWPVKRGTVSFRNVDIPKKMVKSLKAITGEGTVFYNRYRWDLIREKAGLLKLGPAVNGRRPHLESIWQENLLRHTGISYLYQKLGDMKEVCRQAGNSDDTSFRHYLDLPTEGDAKKFYAIAPPALSKVG